MDHIMGSGPGAGWPFSVRNPAGASGSPSAVSVSPPIMSVKSSMPQSSLTALSRSAVVFVPDPGAKRLAEVLLNVYLYRVISPICTNRSTLKSITAFQPPVK